MYLHFASLIISSIFMSITYFIKYLWCHASSIDSIRNTNMNLIGIFTFRPSHPSSLSTFFLLPFAVKVVSCSWLIILTSLNRSCLFFLTFKLLLSVQLCCPSSQFVHILRCANGTQVVQSTRSQTYQVFPKIVFTVIDKNPFHVPIHTEFITRHF
jgi:hypothetical protein